MQKVSSKFRSISQILSSLFLILIFSLTSFAQVNAFSKAYLFTATGRSDDSSHDNTYIDVRGRGITMWQLIFSNVANSVPSACTTLLQSSQDGVNYTTQITATCTADGQSKFFPITASYLRINTSAYTATAIPSTLTVTLIGQIDNAGISPAIINDPVSTTLTARNSTGAIFAEKGSRWTVIHNPAVSNQATASIAAEAGVRHIADCITFSAGSTVAPVLTALTINLRDGATGAGTIIWTHQVIIGAATGQNVAPYGICGLNLIGTTNTAMTLEFSALLTSLIEAVSISGYNIN